MEVENTEVAQTTEGVQESKSENPEILYAGKFKSVSELEKGYKNSESRLGGFTGAPEVYKANEGVEVSEDNPLYSKVQEIGKKYNMNNDMYNDLISMYNETMAEQQAIYDQQVQEEFAKLGDNAQERVRNINDWSKANLSEEEQQALAAVTTDASAVQLVEKLIAMSKPQAMANDNQVQTKPTYDAEKLSQMRNARNEKGERLMSVDLAYQRKVRALEEEYLFNK